MSIFQFLPVEWHESLPSTNTHLAERVKAAPRTAAGTVIAAREQTAGRGRQQRDWLAQPKVNLTFSFLWNGVLPTGHVASMAQAISVGIAQTLVAEGLRPTIKWPNDVLVGGKKIGGILCERVANDLYGCETLVAGIGLNVNMGHAEAAAIDQPATSLAIETGARMEIDDVLNTLLEALCPPLSTWAQDGFAGIRDGYTQFTVPPGTPMRVRDGERHIRGTFLGFGDNGALRIVTEAGERTLYSGDVLY